MVPSVWSPYLLSLVRIVAAFLFMLHGTQKLFAWPVSEARDPVQLMSQMGAAGVLETVGGALLLIGLFTRPVAFLLSGQMAVAYFQAHAPRGPLPILNGGELAVVFCFLFLYFWAAGPGPLSLDATIRRRRSVEHSPDVRDRSRGGATPRPDVEAHHRI
jgi:putative oxidoreductase